MVKANPWSSLTREALVPPAPSIVVVVVVVGSSSFVVVGRSAGNAWIIERVDGPYERDV